MTYVPTKEIKIKERQDKFLKAQLEKEREQALLEEIEKTEKERVKKKGLKVLKSSGILDAYQGLLVSLCKYGLPTEDLYEFSALTILKHEKKLKAQKKTELDKRLKERNAQKALNPARGRAASNNVGAINEQSAAIAAAVGVSPNAAKARVGSKRRVIGANSVERPAPGGQLTNQAKVPGAKKAKGSKAVDGEENPFTLDNDEAEALSDNKPKKKKKRAAADAEDEEVKGEVEAEEEAPKKKKKRARGSQQSIGDEEEAAPEEAPAKKKKKRAKEEEAEVDAEEEEAPRKKKKKRAVAEDEEPADEDPAEEEEAPRKKKKRTKE